LLLAIHSTSVIIFIGNLARFAEDHRVRHRHAAR
jgi:hypothetical protein